MSRVSEKRKEETGTATEQKVKLIKERSHCEKDREIKRETMEVDREFRDWTTLPAARRDRRGTEIAAM